MSAKNKKVVSKAFSFIIAISMVLGMIMPLIRIEASAAAPTSYTNISVGSAVSVSVNSSTTAKYFRFVPTFSGTYRFYSTNNSGDPYVELLDSSGSQIAYDDDNGGSRNFSLSYSLTAGTTYYIKARAYGTGSTASYTLNTALVSVTSTNISAGGTSNVRISTAGTGIFFKFVPTVSASYDFYSTDYTSDPYGELYDASLTKLAHDDDGGSDLNFKITYNCTAGTTYYIYARMLGSSSTGSYTFNVSALPTTPPVTTGNTISLFNSGCTTTSGRAYSTSGNGVNPDTSSYTNNGYDIYGCSPSSTDLTLRTGLSFTVNNPVTQRAVLTIYAYDIDEERDQIDDVYLVDETSGGTRTRVGYLNGRNETWATTTIYIDPSNFVVGHTYHIEVDVCKNGWWTWIRTVSIQLYQEDIILESSFSGSISNTGLVSTNLYLRTSTSTSFNLEYTATISGTQRGGSTGTITANSTGVNKALNFQLESDAPEGTYVVNVILKDAQGNTLITYEFTSAGPNYSAVNYDANGGSNNTPIDTTSYTSGNTVTVRFDYLPSKDGYIFLGWSTDRNATEPMYTEDGTKTFTIGENDVTLYAVWREDVCYHDFIIVSDSEPTCSREGERVYECVYCGDTYTEAIPRIDHVFVERIITYPTCTEPGSKHPDMCILPGCDLEYITMIIEIPALGHDFVSGTCTRCGEIDTTPPADVWDGTVDTSWYNSTATEFTIYTAEQLAGLAQLVNDGNNFSGKTIYLGNNIDLAGREWTPIGKGHNTSDTYASTSRFSGSFDGRYHTVLNMSILDGETTFSGFFGSIYGSASISNLGIADARIDITRTLNYRTTAGILAGATGGNVSISNCYAIGTVSVVDTGGHIIDIGGFVGDCYDAVIVNCYCVADVSAQGRANQMVGVFCGWADSDIAVTNCFSYGSCVASGTGERFTGGFGGGDQYWHSSNVYYCSSTSDRVATSLSEEALRSITSFVGWDFTNVWEFRPGSDYPVLIGFGNPIRPHAHTFEETSRTEATCTTDGIITYTCSCGDTRVEIVRATGHNIETTVEIEVTCTTDGLIVDRCTNSGCNYEKRTIIHGEHNYSITDRQEATCTIEGYIEYTCSNCGDKNYEYIEGRHNYVESSRVEPQVGVEGSITYTCTHCSDSYSVAIPALNPVLKNSAVLLIQDSLPWAEDVNRSLLEALKDRGVVSSYNIINTTALESFDLSQYGVVFIANDQSTAMYNRLAANAEKFENYVRAGGNLIYGACDEGWGGCGSLTHNLPGGVTTANYYSVHNYIVNDLHPIVTGVYTDNRSLRDELLKGNYCSHTYFNTASLPAGSDIILRDANGNPTLVEYNLGDGTVIASGLTWEYFYVRNHYSMVTNYSKYVYDDLVTYMVYMSNTCEHEYEVAEIVEATCVENGYTKYVCTLCSYEYMTDIVIAPGHCNEMSRVEPTCYSDGCITYTCTNPGCDYEEIIVIPGGHQWEMGVPVPPTCEEDGYTESVCAVCGETRYDDIIPAPGHVESDWIIDTEATCITEGIKHTECTVCGEYIQTEVIPALGHEESDWIVDREATCITGGSMHTECTRCQIIMQISIIPPTGIHTEGEWIIDLEPTCVTTGVKHTECTVCGTTVSTDIIPATGIHTESDWILDFEPTCVVNGSEYKKCTVCHTVLETKVIPAPGYHVPGDWIVVVEPTGTTEGLRQKVCTVCEEVVEEESISMLIELSIANVTVNRGSTVDVDVVISNNPGIIGAVLTFNYDSALTLVNARAGDAWSSLNFTKPAVFQSPCNFVWDGSTAADTNGTVITLTFEVPENADFYTVYDISASYTVGNVLDASYSNVDLRINAGSITVVPLMGDANEDGVVDVADIVILRRYLAGGYGVTINIEQSDMNYDGCINIVDLVMLRRYIVGA